MTRIDGWSFRDFDSQFRETEWERRERWREVRARRTVEGKCWQCGAKTADCTCPNIKHPKTPA